MQYKDTFERNNAVSVFLMSALPAAAGSVISFMLSAFLVWAVISLFLKRFEYRLTGGDLVICWTTTIFVLTILATAIVGENLQEMPEATFWLLPFLSVWVVIPRLRATPDVDYIQHFVVGAAVGAIAGLCIALAQVMILEARVEGGAGNAAVFGMISLFLAAAASINVTHAERRFRILAAAGVAAGLVAVVLSLTRGALLAGFATIVLLAIYAPRPWRMTPPARLASVAIALACAFSLYLASDLILERVQTTIHEVQLVLDKKYTLNIGERLRLWKAGWQVIADSQIWGHGIQNRMDELDAVLAHDGGPKRAFTHAHNAYITFAVDGGVIVLAALAALLAVPVVVAWRAERDENYRRRLFLTLQVCVAYAICGLTQILFKHDLMDSFYVFFMILVAASIPSARAAATR